MENYGNNTKDGSGGSERSGKIYQVLWDKLIEMSNIPKEILPGVVE
jgi:hypothetical protein